MNLKFKCLGSGFFEGHTRDNRTFQRLRMMGFVYDCDGAEIPATCDMGFGATMDSDPKAGETVIVDISSFDVKSAMAAMTFTRLSHVAPGARELKH